MVRLKRASVLAAKVPTYVLLLTITSIVATVVCLVFARGLSRSICSNARPLLLNSTNATNSGGKKFAYLVTAPSTRDDSRLQSSESRDVYWLTFKEKKSTDSPLFVLHRPETRWGAGRNHLTALAFAAPTEYEYYVYLDEDMLDSIIGVDPWTEFENWLLEEKPPVGFLPYSAIWCPKEKGPTSRRLFFFDFNVLALHKSAVGPVALFDTSWEHLNDEFGSCISCWLMYSRFPNGLVGYNGVKFNSDLNRHTRVRKKWRLNFGILNRYILSTYFAGTIPTGVPEKWFSTDGAELLKAYGTFRKDLLIVKSLQEMVKLAETAICLFGRRGAKDAPASLAKRVRSRWKADLFQADRYAEKDEDHLVVQWFDRNAPGWRSSTRGGDYLSGLPSFGNGTSANELVDRHECLNQIRKAESARGAHYKRVAIGRANLVWTDDHPDIEVSGNTCWVARGDSSEDSTYGHWALCGRGALDSLVEGPMAALPWKGHGVTVEEFLKAGWKERGVNIRQGIAPFHRTHGGLEYLPQHGYQAEEGSG